MTLSPDKPKKTESVWERASTKVSESVNERRSVCVYLQVQLKPFPLNPALQRHWYEPSVFEQLALRSHSFWGAWHSSTSKRRLKATIYSSATDLHTGMLERPAYQLALQ